MRRESWQRIRGELGRAFAIPRQVDTLTPEDHQLLDKLADLVVKRKLTEIVSFSTALCQPLNFVGSQVLHAAEPLATWFFDRAQYRRLAELLEDRQVLPLFQEKLEKAERDRSAPVQENELSGDPP